MPRLTRLRSPVRLPAIGGPKPEPCTSQDIVNFMNFTSTRGPSTGPHWCDPRVTLAPAGHKCSASAAATTATSAPNIWIPLHGTQPGRSRLRREARRCSAKPPSTATPVARAASAHSIACAVMIEAA